MLHRSGKMAAPHADAEAAAASSASELVPVASTALAPPVVAIPTLAMALGGLALSCVHAAHCAAQARSVDAGSVTADLGAFLAVCCLGASLIDASFYVAWSALCAAVWVCGSFALLPLTGVLAGIAAGKRAALAVSVLDEAAAAQCVWTFVVLPGFLWASRPPGSISLACLAYGAHAALSAAFAVHAVGAQCASVALSAALVFSNSPVAFMVACALTAWTCARSDAPHSAWLLSLACLALDGGAAHRAVWLALGGCLAISLRWTDWAARQRVEGALLAVVELVAPSPGVVLSVAGPFATMGAALALTAALTWCAERVLVPRAQLRAATGPEAFAVASLALATMLAWQQGAHLALRPADAEPAAAALVLFACAVQAPLVRFAWPVRAVGLALLVAAAAVRWPHDAAPVDVDAETWAERAPAAQRALCRNAARVSPGVWLAAPAPLPPAVAAVSDARFELHAPAACAQLQRLPWRDLRVKFVGDSVVRFLYHAYVTAVLDSEHGVPQAAAHADLAHDERASFTWAPFIADVVANGTWALADARVDVVVLGAGPWDALHRRDPDAYARSMALLGSRIASKRCGLAVWVEFGALQDAKMLTADKRAFLVEAKAAAFRNAAATSVEPQCDWVLPLRAIELGRSTRDGVHYDWSTYLAAIGVMLRAL